ncbi:MAG: LapA family protein [Gammaproteobacteria bacterium]
MSRIIGFIFLVFLVFLGLSFAVLNSAPVPFNYYFNKQDIPLSFLLVVTLAIGAVLGMIASTGILVRQKRTTKKLCRQVVSLEKEALNASERLLQ